MEHVNLVVASAAIALASIALITGDIVLALIAFSIACLLPALR